MSYEFHGSAYDKVYKYDPSVLFPETLDHKTTGGRQPAQWRGKAVGGRKKRSASTTKSKSVGKTKMTRSRSRSTKCKKLLHLKKYRERNSPAFSAASCRNAVKVGNDGQKYVSTRNKNGVFTWKRA